MSWRKMPFKIFSGLIFVIVFALGLLYYSAATTSNEKSRMIDDLAKAPVGSSVEEVISLAENLGFNFESKEYAIPSVVQMTNEDSPDGVRRIPVKVNKGTDFSKFKNGTLDFGLSLFFFERKGCEITFKNGTVRKTRIWVLD